MRNELSPQKATSTCPPPISQEAVLLPFPNQSRSGLYVFPARIYPPFTLLTLILLLYSNELPSPRHFQHPALSTYIASGSSAVHEIDVGVWRCDTGHGGDGGPYSRNPLLWWRLESHDKRPNRCHCTISIAVAETHRLNDANQPPERVIQVLRKAMDLSDYEEAIAIADKIVAAHSPGDRLTPTQRHSIELIKYLEDAIHRLHTLTCLPSLPNQDRARLAVSPDNCERQRAVNYFGITGNSRETPPNPSGEYLTYFFFQRPAPRDWGTAQLLEKVELLKEILGTIPDVRITDVEAAVELGRLDYLDEAITTHRDLRNVSAQKPVHYQMGEGLLRSLIARCNLLHLEQDIEEVMQLFPEVVNDGSTEAFRRFQISYGWAHNARIYAHPSTSIAYKTAMSLMEETLVFSPTLQIQHFLLVRVPTKVRGLPLDYASYQIETGRIKQAIETLERGRALLWSEMRGLRTSTDQLQRFAAINRDLERVTMSVAQNENMEMGDGEAGPGMDAFGRLLLRQRKLSEERGSLITHIQSLSGLGNFLKPLPFDALNCAAIHGPVIIINQSRWRSDIIILHKDSPPSVIFTPPNFHNRANQLRDQLLRTQKEKGLDSIDYDHSSFCPRRSIRARGKTSHRETPPVKHSGKISCLVVPDIRLLFLSSSCDGSYSVRQWRQALLYGSVHLFVYPDALRAHRILQTWLIQNVVQPFVLLVAQPETLPGARSEIDVVQLDSGPQGPPIRHFVCHGLLETEFAFLSACHTAELTEASIPTKDLHLAAAMQFCGFPAAVIGTMWAMADTDGADLSKHFYKYVFSESPGRRGVPHYERSARALQFAVKKLRRKRGMTLERWSTLFIFGA
ncbi:hypothetical protein H4582DRAFT_2192548 [Lactarius indigo]|nr:hypothetical protein H4582DRAFT_2192548 [Lactarius indigo]